jgi:hypothetical protein
MPEPPFCAIPVSPGLTGRIAAGFCPSEVREIGAGPGNAGTHLGHTRKGMAFRSKPEGMIPAGPESLTRWFLSLSRLVRCRGLPGRTADDAVLTLKILFLGGR